MNTRHISLFLVLLVSALFFNACPTPPTSTLTEDENIGANNSDNPGGGDINDGLVNTGGNDVSTGTVNTGTDVNQGAQGGATQDNSGNCITDTDGDGICNELDTDLDGDGTLNIDDTDIDGDGILNTGDADIDGDGILNINDIDIDGDGIINIDDTDIDGDGILNDLDTDIDGDGIINIDDSDIDGDGRINIADNDIDGDGILNTEDPDIDGDGNLNINDNDIDGDGILNENDPDIDSDGIPNDQDPDTDGDGIANSSDNDMDGDGVVNEQDHDMDGDGIPDDLDTNKDGDAIPDDIDADIDGDGLANEIDPDVDGDGLINEEDGDDDGDGIPDENDLTPKGPTGGQATGSTITDSISEGFSIQVTSLLNVFTISEDIDFAEQRSKIADKDIDLQSAQITNITLRVDASSPAVDAFLDTNSNLEYEIRISYQETSSDIPKLILYSPPFGSTGYTTLKLGGLREGAMLRHSDNPNDFTNTLIPALPDYVVFSQLFKDVTKPSAIVTMELTLKEIVNENIVLPITHDIQVTGSRSK